MKRESRSLGKGDNSWDIEDDAIFSIGINTWDIEQALREGTNDILDTRRNYGGDTWTPEEAKQRSTTEELPHLAEQPVETGDEEEEVLTFSLRLKHEIDPKNCGRVLAYALPKGQGNPQQEALIEAALKHRPLPDHLRGSATTVDDLAGTWAVDEEYGVKIVRKIRGLLAGE